MWDSFLDRTSHSCGRLPQNSSCYKHTKTDIFSVESLNYIPKEILCSLDPLHMKDTKPSNPKKGTPKSNTQKSTSSLKQYIPVPVYYKVNTEGKTARAISAPACKKIRDCKCRGPQKKLTDFDKLSKNLDQLIPEETSPKADPLAGLTQKIEQLKRKLVPQPILKSSSSNDFGSIDSLQEKNYSLISTNIIIKLKKPCDNKICSPESRRIYKERRRKRAYARQDFWRTVWFGERGSGTRTSTGEAQDFYKIQQDCLNKGILFEDPEFPATDESLFTTQRPDRCYEWRRPHEISDDPRFFVEGFSRFDIQQGELGDCWLLAAAANLTLYRRLFFQIIPDDQEFDEKYAGIFHFRFWQYGKWIDIVIDDRLPTYRGQLVYLHSTEENEFWSALLEKAYAKLNGSYEALKGGSTCEAMEDFTGGVTEMYEMDSSPPNLFQIILKAYDRSSLMGCSIEPDPQVLEAQTPEGLVRGHAYSITRVQYIDIQTPNVTGKIPLLRLRNPWGNESEWNGAWSDGAPEWRFISDSQKEELGLTFDNDGEFWMSYKDFIKYFSRLEICNLNPDSLSEDEIREGNKKKWEMSVFEGEWVRGVTAGGCRNYIDTFWRNPQYRITLTECDEGDDDNTCTMIVGLMQKNRRQVKSISGVDLLTIGFAIYHLPYPDRVPKPLDLNFFRYNASVARSPSFINLREVSCRFKLPPGTYCIVPSTFDPNEEGEFLLRVFTEKQNVMEEHDEEVQYGDIDELVKTEPDEEEKEEFDRVNEFFLQLAGEDKEVDWLELKKILDFSLKSELQQKKLIAEQPKKTVKEVNATPSQTEEINVNCFSAAMSLICGVLCKDLETVPVPNSNTMPLNAVMSELKVEGFSKDVCRSMVAMLDSDRSGKLGYIEFKELWEAIRTWKNVWLMYDQDKSGTFSGFELRDALNSAGYRINNKVLNILMHRYGNRSGQLEFDDFMMCSIKLKSMIDIFNKKSKAETKTASFTMEEWLEATLYS